MICFGLVKPAGSSSARSFGATVLGVTAFRLMSGKPSPRLPCESAGFQVTYILAQEPLNFMTPSSPVISYPYCSFLGCQESGLPGDFGVNFYVPPIRRSYGGRSVASVLMMRQDVEPPPQHMAVGSGVREEGITCTSKVPKPAGGHDFGVL